MATINYPENPSPVADAEAIRKACQGWGTDEKAIISIFGHRNATQKKLIRRAYEELYNEDLVKRLESELSGHFEAMRSLDPWHPSLQELSTLLLGRLELTTSWLEVEKAVYRWILDPEDRDAVMLHAAIKETPIPDYRVIIEYSCIYSPEEFLAVKRAYQARYKRSVEEDLAEHSAGDLRKLLVALVGIYRYAGKEINARVANTEADNLHSAICNKEFNHEEIVRIISTRSIPQLIATLNRYKDDYGSSITKHLRDDANAAKEYLVALRTTIRCINDPQKYYEKVIRYAINESGTDEESLTRVIVTRAEKDLKDIKEIYYKRNSVTLDHAVSKHTSGDYKAFLLTLLGNDN